MWYVFGDCTLDTERRELRHAEMPVPLERKVYQVLAYLVQHADRLVLKDELLENIWPNVYVTDKVVARCIAAIRKAVGDHWETQGVIQTVHGQGYRFVAPLAAYATRPAGKAVIDASYGVSPMTAPVPVSPPAALPAASASSVVMAPSAASPLALSGERKLVTVLCCRLAQTAAMAEGIDPEEQHNLLHIFFAHATVELHRYGGTISHLPGDGFVAFFGAPVAQEDHAQRAVLAAVRLRERLGLPHTDVGDLPGETLALCMGLHTGLVVIGQTDAAVPLTYMAGDTMALATRLAQHAVPGTIVLSETTARLVAQTVRVEVLPADHTRSVTAALPAYRVLGVLPARAPVARPGARTLTPFMGRQRELSTLHALLAQAEQERGQVVGIMGEPGMGKSRLLYEFRRSLRERRVTYLAGQCVSYGSTTPYLPVLDLLRQQCGCTDTDAPDAIRAKVRQRLREAALAFDDAAPCLFQLLGVQEYLTAAEHPAPGARKQRTFEVLHQMSLQSSRQQPLILEVENLQWVDPSSEEYLTALLERLPGVAILLLMTYRPGYRPLWMDKSYATQLTLPPLAPEESQRVVHALLQATPAVDTLIPVILTKAKGNPLFLEELARAVVAQGPEQTRWAVPDTLQAVLAVRLDRLPAAEKHLLQTAAVVGKEVTVPLLQALTALPEDVLCQYLEHLQAAELLYETRLLPDRTYAFTHVLVQDVAYQSLLRRTLQQLHAQIARVILERFPQLAESQPELVAHHYTAAGLAMPAVDYWQKAGQRALERSAYAEALAHLTQGIDLLRGLPDPEGRTQRELALLVALGPVFYAVKGWVSPDMAHLYTRARTLCCHAEAPQLLPVLYGLWQVHSNRGEQGPAQELAAEFLHLAQRQRHPALKVVGCSMMGATLFRQGEFSDALEYLTHGTRLDDPQQHQALSALYMADPGSACHYFSAHILWLLGYPDQAVQQCQAALTLAQQRTHPLSLARAQYFRTVLCHFRREVSQAQEWAETAMAHAQAQGFPSWTLQATMLRGWACVMRGDTQAGMAQISAGVRMFQTAEGELPLPYPLSLLAEALYANGQIVEGLRVLAKVLTLMEQGGICWWQAEIHRLTGECLLRQEVPEPTGAEQQFQQALALARQQHAKSLELRAAMSLSRLWRSQGQQTAARQLLTEVYHWFTEGFDTADLQDARALLGVLS